MIDETVVRVNEAVSIPRSELEYRATRGGGPGGQHVNTSSTRVELTWNVVATRGLDEAQRQRVLAKLATRIDGAGVLRLVSAGSRSQLQNREEVTERFAAMIEKALRVPKPRKRTKVPKGVKEDRLREKKMRSETKRNRERITPDE
jgi:ribosome-associated protein